MTGESMVGRRVLRCEDPRFLTGQGRFTDDLSLEGEVHAVMVRSPHPHARIVRVDLASARAAPGVLAADRRGNKAPNGDATRVPVEEFGA